MKAPAVILTGPFLAAVGLSGGQTVQEVIAQQELNTLASQMAIVQMDTTYFTTLENLDDLSSVTNVNEFDYINDEGGMLAVIPSTGKFREPSRVDVFNLTIGLGWNGPYVSYQPGTIDDEDSDYDEGTPLDPWGTPYYFYSPLGLVDPKREEVVLEGYLDDFDQYTVVSYGNDRVKSEDDLTATIPGFAVVVSTVSSVRAGAPPNPPDAIASRREAPYEARIKGYRLGETPGTVSIDGEEISPVTSWSETEIRVPLETLPAENSMTTVQTSGGKTLLFEGVVIEGSTSVGSWQLY